MNKIINFLAVILFLISCQKEEVVVSQVPDWFVPIIQNLENSGQCFDCSITRITYNNKTYYHLYCGLWSCMYCNLFDSQGNLVEWKEGEFDDFLKNKKDDTVIWQCNAKSD